MEEAKQHLRLLSCVLDAKDFTKLLALASFDEKIESGKSAACLAIRNDGTRVLLIQVYKDRWFSADPDALNRHPVSVARAVQTWFQQLATQPWGVSACYPLASIEANLSLRALKTQVGVGAQMKKFLTDQLKDREEDNHAPSRVRLSIFERAHYADLYKWCRGPCFHDASVGGFEGLRKLLFEIVWTLSVAQAVAPGFKHNDLHAANVLVTIDKLAMAAVKPLANASAAAAAAATVALAAAEPSPIALASADDVIMGGVITPCASAAPTATTVAAPPAASASAVIVLPQDHFYYQYTVNVPAVTSDGAIAPAGTAPPSTTTTTTHAAAATEVASPLASSRHRPTFPGPASSTATTARGGAGPTIPISFVVPAYCSKALLADFDFAWMTGSVNQKVLEFQTDDPVWGVTSTHDDSYDVFMLAYHLYITFFEQMLERNQGVCAEVFTRAWRKSNTAAEAGDDEGAKLWRLSGLNDVRTYHVTRDQMVRLWEPQRDLQQFLEFIVPHRFFQKTDRQLEADGIHRWRYNEVAVAAGLHRELHTPMEALQHGYFATFRNLAAPSSPLLKSGVALRVVTHPINTSACLPPHASHAAGGAVPAGAAAHLHHALQPLPATLNVKHAPGHHGTPAAAAAVGAGGPETTSSSQQRRL